MSEVRVCFLGTPEFASYCLEHILKDEHFRVVGVVTQPDRPKGRNLQLTPSDVKTLAIKHQLPVLTPESLRKDHQAVEEIRSWKAEVAIVVAFGQILDQSFLDLFPFGCVNVHASLLPRWRGAAPIQRCLEAGDLKTGVCLQKMVLKLDAGDIIGQRELNLNSEINSLELHDELKKMGADLLHVELMDYVRGHLVPTPQDESRVTVAKKIDKLESLLDFKQTAEILHNKTRAFVWGPGVYTFHKGQRLKVYKTRIITSLEGAPGVILKITPEGFAVGTGDGALEILVAQPENKSRMPASEIVQRLHLQVGDQLGK